MKLESRLLLVMSFLLALPAAAQDKAPKSLAVSKLPATATGIAQPTSRQDYVGDDACGHCHQGKVETFHNTNHYLTSRLPERNSILGNFDTGANILKTSNPDLFYRMEAAGDGFFQSAVQGIAPYTTSRTERFAFVVGSGGKGQTYLYWKGDLLFQLPVSYWKEVGWVNSPGYRDGVAYFDRPIIPRCLECHGTSFDSLPPPANRYRKSGFVVGITCEKCHGPGRAHVQRFSSNPEQVSDPAILNPARFSRDRQLDLCAWCHAGHGTPIQATSSYMPGEPLARYIQLPEPDSQAPVDVHGSQVELLQRSRCFQSSTMTCQTCHDAHATEKNLADFSQHCLSCHKADHHPKIAQLTTGNCVDCHMPKQQTNLIVFDFNGHKARPEVRSHWIKVY